MKKCPYCAEEIQDEAIKCHYCGEMLNKQAQPAVTSPIAPQEQKDSSREKSDGFMLSWIFGILFLLIGLGVLSSRGFLPGIVFLIMASIILPPISSLIEKKSKVRLTRGIKAIVLIVGFGIILATANTEKATEKRVQEEQIAEKKEVDEFVPPPYQQREAATQKTPQLKEGEVFVQFNKDTGKLEATQSDNSAGTKKSFFVKINPATGKSEVVNENPAQPQTKEPSGDSLVVSKELKAAGDYINQVEGIVKSVGEYLLIIGNVMMKQATDEWSLEDKTRFAVDSVLLKKTYDQAKALKAPTRYKELHGELLKALKFYAEEMPILGRAFESQDIDKIKRAEQLFPEANRQMLRVVHMVDVIRSRLKDELEWEPFYLRLLKKHTETELKKIYYKIIECEYRLMKINSQDNYKDKCENPIRSKTKLDEDEIEGLVGFTGVDKRWPCPAGAEPYEW